MRVYIAGPMTGLPDYNRPAFYAAERQLIAAGHHPLNPAALPVVDDWAWTDYMRHALAKMLDAEAVALLGAWFDSRGAKLEVHVAGQLGMDVRPLEEWLTT